MIEKSLFSESDNQLHPLSGVDNQPEGGLQLDQLYEEAKRKGVVNAIIEFSSVARDSDKDKFDGVAEDEKARLQANAKIVYPDEAGKSERLNLFLGLAKKTSIPYALNWILEECPALFVSTNDEEDPYRGNG